MKGKRNEGKKEGRKERRKERRGGRERRKKGEVEGKEEGRKAEKEGKKEKKERYTERKINGDEKTEGHLKQKLKLIVHIVLHSLSTYPDDERGAGRDDERLPLGVGEVARVKIRC